MAHPADVFGGNCAGHFDFLLFSVATLLANRLESHGYGPCLAGVNGFVQSRLGPIDTAFPLIVGVLC